MVKFVSTRSDFGTIGFNNWTGAGSPPFAVTATPVVPSSYSMIEVISTNGSTSGGQPGNIRHWSYVATADGALRLDPMLSMPGPNAHLDSYLTLSVYRIHSVVQTPTTLTYEQEPVTIVPNGTAPWLGVNSLYFSGQSSVGGHGTIVVEAGSTYLIRIFATRAGSIHRQWGVSLRVSELRTTAEDGEVWYQMPNRTVNSRGAPGWSFGVGQPAYWNNVDPIDPWDKVVAPNMTGSDPFAGNFQWSRSFHGLDPVTGIGSYLAITHAWQHACSESRKTFPTIFASNDFDGTQQGLPGEYPYAPAHYGALGSGGISIGGGLTGIGAWNKWAASSSGLGLFEYADSEMEMWMGALYLSLHYEAWDTGPMVYYEPDDMLAFTGVDSDDVVGFIYEDLLPEVVRVQVVPDWGGYKVVASSSQDAPAQWWVGKTRYIPSMNWTSGADPPDPAAGGVGWGPFVGTGNHPGGPFIPGPQWVLGDTSTGKWPRGYIDEMNMVHLGDYTTGMLSQPAGSMTTWEVPEEVWRAAWDVELEMDEYEELHDEYRDPENREQYAEYAYEFYQPLGLTFMVGTAEALATTPIGPGVPQPSTQGDTSHAKGLHHLTLWPKITYKPTRFKLVYAPELEIPLLTPTGGPLTLRQHFSPLLGGADV